MKFEYSSLTKIGFQRYDNEDAIGVYETNEGLLTVVCDGLGGNKAGEIASQLCRDVIHSCFIESIEPNYLERIKFAIVEANKKIMNKADDNLNLKGMATTAEVLFIKDSVAYWGHVGDSRIYNFKNGKLKQLTKDHSLIQKLIDDGYLTMKEAENHPNKNIITRAIGDNLTIDVDVSKLRLNSKDDIKFLVCTDGVTTVVSDIELETIINGYDFKTIPEKLSHLIEERGAPDNFSFVFIGMKN